MNLPFNMLEIIAILPHEVCNNVLLLSKFATCMVAPAE